MAMPKHYFSIYLLVVIPLYAASAQTEIYKWVGRSGVVHYSDKAPTTHDLQKYPNNAKRKAAHNIKKALCNEKRILLAALQEKGFSAYYDEEGQYRLAWGGDDIYQGKRRFLSDKEVIKKTAYVIFEIGQYCDAPYDQALQKTARANWIRAEYCTVSKAVLEDLEHPFMRASDGKIRQQKKVVKRLCAKLKPQQHRNDDRYYPKALRANVVLPRHLTLKEEAAPDITKITQVSLHTPQVALTQRLDMIK